MAMRMVTPRELLHELRPECARCGRRVERVETYYLAARAGMQVILHCHGEVEVSTLDDEFLALLMCGDRLNVEIPPAFVDPAKMLGDGTPMLTAGGP